MQATKAEDKQRQMELVLICRREIRRSVIVGNQEVNHEMSPKSIHQFADRTGQMIKAKILITDHERIMARKNQSWILQRMCAQKHGVSRLQITPRQTTMRE